MTPDQQKGLREAAQRFWDEPSPQAADDILRLLAPHRENEHVQNMIDEILGYKFAVGSIPAASEVKSLKTRP